MSIKNKILKTPKELFEEKKQQEIAKLQSLEELKQTGNEVATKKILTPKDFFNENVEEKEIIEENVEEVEENIIIEEIDLYQDQIDEIKNKIFELENIIPEEVNLDEVKSLIFSLDEKFNSSLKSKDYSEDIQNINSELKRIENLIQIPETFDPSEIYDNISILKDVIEEVRSEIPSVPQPILYDDQLEELHQIIESVRNSIPSIPEVKYYDDELNSIIRIIDEVRKEIPEIQQIPEIKYYDEQISEIEDKLLSIQNSIPVVPKVKYYDEDIKNIDENVKVFANNFSSGLQKLNNKIEQIKNSIPVVPEVKYYDEEIGKLYESISSIKIPDENLYFDKVKTLYASFEEKNRVLLRKINYLEEVFESFNESVILNEELAEPPEIKNSDPLTPLDKNYVTLEDLQKHYRLFINRIQQQLATIGGGGETRLQYLDDIVGIATNPSAYDGKYLRYNHSIGKFEFKTVSGGGGGDSYWTPTDNANAIYTLENVAIGTDNVNGNSTSLWVEGNTRITGIISVGSVESENAFYSGIITASSFSGNATSATYASTAGVATYSTSSGISTYAISSGIATYASTAGIATVAQGLTGTPNIIVGIATASTFVGNLTGTATTSTNLSNAANITTGTINSARLSGTYNIDISGNSQYAAFSGISTYANTAGISTYSSTAGISTYATTAGISTYAISSGIATYASTSGISTYATTAGISTYATTAGIATYATTAGVATALQNSRTFEITGDIIASPVSFNGTGNVSLAATIQPNSVGLGTDTTGDYVQSITGTANQITVTGGSGEGSTPVISIPSNPTLPGNVTIANDLQVNNNLNVTGNITIGGTSAYIISNDFRVKDADIVVGYTTDSNGNDVSNDTTANHGGIAVASTEGSPLIEIYNPGIGETNPATYKKIMWFKSGSFTGLNTDAWLINYGVGIGSTQFPSGTRLAVGSVQITEYDLAVVRNINASGIVTGSFVGNLSGNSTTSGYASTSGIATVAQGLTGTPNISVGVVTATTYNGSGINLTGIVTTITAGSNISINQSTGNVIINAVSFLGIATADGTVGSGVTLIDLRGAGISTVTVSSGIATLNITGGGSATPEISSVMMGMIF